MNPAGMNELPLRDIHLPESVSWWPPAPGWWLLMALFILLMVTGLWLYRRHRNPGIRKLAMRELDRIRRIDAHNQDPLETLQECSKLLRRVAMSMTGRQQSASLIGDAWRSRLHQLSDYRFSDSFINTLVDAPYQPHTSIDSRAMLDECQQWLNKLRKEPAP